MPIQFDKGRCSLGFYGVSKQFKHYLAVTAGHCSRYVGEAVYGVATGGDMVRLGQVVARVSDHVDGDGKAIGQRGFTMFEASGGFEPRVNGAGYAYKDAEVTQRGERTGLTKGRIIGVNDPPGDPGSAVIASDDTQLPGDSGAPWSAGPDVLVGITSGSAKHLALAQPIDAVVELIRNAGFGDFAIVTR
ncbi:MAG: hypothetical protein JOZ49_05720 [Mycolicibacterium sp.]|nr:hypothetical protein [Mycolicibacterium sp.]